jgi:peptide chain release factor 1
VPEAAYRMLLREAGGHRWQHTPAHDRKGRTHTSTVTVAVLEVLKEHDWTIPEKEIEITTTRDSGPGGQHRNTTDSCVIMCHIPTGIKVKAAAKSQHQNKREARALLEAKVKDLRWNQAKTEIDHHRANQVGSGMRGDKIRTYRVKDNQAVDDRSGRKVPLKKVLNGHLELLN